MPNCTKFLTICLIVNSILLSTGCQKKKELKIGDTYQGGVIFYLDNTGEHGLIAAPGDQGVYAWGCNGVIEAYGAGIGSGNPNTTNIVNFCGGTAAAATCANLVIGDYSDWFLPTKDELNEMFIRRYEVGGFQNGWYWSSFASTNGSNALKQDFSSGIQSMSLRSNFVNVRAIRSF